MTELATMTAPQQTAIEAAVFRKLLAHLEQYPEVQNIDLMNLAYFCRNCFAKWYVRAAAEQGLTIDYEQARAQIYGMPFADYKAQHQQPATEQQLARFAISEKNTSE